MDAKDQARQVVEEWWQDHRLVPRLADVAPDDVPVTDDLIARLTPIFERAAESEQATQNALEQYRLAVREMNRAEQAEAAVRRLRNAIAVLLLVFTPEHLDATSGLNVGSHLREALAATEPTPARCTKLVACRYTDGELTRELRECGALMPCLEHEEPTP